MLHIVRQSPFESPSWKRCLGALLRDDVLLLIENGVFCGLQKTKSHNLPFALVREGRVFVLEEDAVARGIAKRLIDDIQRINFDAFVDLTITHYPIMQW
jgi:tRNA 2-thiouridine synthesizing protein B